MISTLKEKIIKSINISRALGIAVLSIFFSLVFSDKISNWVINQVHYIPVTIISSEWATDNSDKGRFICDANAMGTILSNNGFEIVPEDSGQVVFYPLYENADISFEMPAYPNVHITFETGSEDGIFVFLKDGKYIRSIGEYEREVHSINYYFFSFSELFYIYLWYLLFYIIISFSIFLALNGIYIVGNKIRTRFLLDRKGKIISFAALSVIYFIYVCVNYSLHADLFQAGKVSDAFYYMYPSYLDAEGRFSLQTYVGATYSFRGYLPHIIAICGNLISGILRIDVMYFYFFLGAILIGASLCFFMPLLYEEIFKKKVSILSPALMFLLFMLFWRSHAFYYLSDIPSAFLAIDALAIFVKALNGQHAKRDLVIAGICIGAAAGYRNAYSYIAYSLIVICVFKDIFLCRKLSKSTVTRGLARGALLCAGLILILWPQFIINKERGHIGIFPYDGGWAYDVENGEGLSLLELSFSQGLHSYQFMSNTDSDQQLKIIDAYLYGAKESYYLKDICFIILDHPKEYFSGYLKKLFWALSAGYETVYNALPIPDWQVNILIILNYMMLWNVLSQLIVGKHFEKSSGKIISAILLCGLFLNVAPQGLLHIERRYFLFFYLLIYLYNSFLLFESKDRERLLNARYCIGAVLFCAVCYAFRMTILLNFL